MGVEVIFFLEALMHNETTSRIINAAFKVHSKLGCGFLEPVYQHALKVEFDHQGIPHQREFSFEVSYRGVDVGHYIADFFVDDKVIVEIKALSETSRAHISQVINYLKATRCRVGLLLNFGTPSLQIRRLVL